MIQNKKNLSNLENLSQNISKGKQGTYKLLKSFFIKTDSRALACFDH